MLKTCRVENALNKAGIDFIEGRVRFVDQQTIAVDPQQLTANSIVLAPAQRPCRYPSTASNGPLTAARVWNLTIVPLRIVFVGGGFISFEFAHFAVRLGLLETRCTILEAGPRPLGPFAEEMVGLLVDTSAAEGIDIHCDVTITGIQKTAGGLMITTNDDRWFEADLVVHGAGRAPDIESLDLERAGIDHTRKGITVDRRMRTTNPHVYAVGDCADTIQLARVADAEAQVAADNIIARPNGKNPEAAMDYAAVPAVLFTYP